MQPPAVPSTSFRQQQTTRQQILRHETLDEASAEQERFELLEELTRDVEDAETFRFHAPSSQRRQDHHLYLYQHFIVKYVKKIDDSNMERDEIDELLFPENIKDMCDQLKLFVAWVFKRTVPRARAAKYVTIGTMDQYRNSMLFWASLRCTKIGRELPYRQLNNEMIRTIRYVHKKFKGQDVPTIKTWLGLAELRELLDFEAMSNVNVEYSEQHQVLWCIGRLTALRPGSLCEGDKFGRQRALVWSDFTFTRTEHKGEFDVVLKLAHLDIKRPGDAFAAERTIPSVHPVNLRMLSPPPDGLILSVAHRLLVIALRRNLLEGIATVEELLAGDKHQISIRADKLQEQIFFGGKSKGAGIDRSKPLRANQLTEVLSNRARQIGYPDSVTWYSIRRRAATDLEGAVGRENARAVLGHRAGSGTLEKHYLNLDASLNVSGILTASAKDQSRFTQRDSDWAPLAESRLREEAVQRTRGAALADMTSKMIMADSSVPDTATPAELKAYRIRVRRIAQRHLLEMESQLQRQNITQDEMNQRKESFSVSEVAKAVLKRAVADISKNGSSGAEAAEAVEADEDTDNDDADGSRLVDRGAGEDEDEQEAEVDLETRLRQGTNDGNSELTFEGEANPDVNPDADKDSDHTTTDVSYVGLARTFMNLLLDNSASNYVPWSKANQLCPDCQEDATVDDEVKAKPFQSAIHLQSHLDSNFHHPVTRWRRAADQRANAAGGKYHCPYCTQARVLRRFVSKKGKFLIHHIVDSDELNTNKTHDELKSADGWYSSDFANPLKLPATPDSQRKLRKEAERKAKAAGINVAPVGRQIPFPLIYSEGIVRGPQPPAPLSVGHAQLIQPGFPESVTASDSVVAMTQFPVRLHPFVNPGLLDSADPLPDFLRDVVVVTDHPRSAEDDALRRH